VRFAPLGVVREGEGDVGQPVEGQHPVRPRIVDGRQPAHPVLKDPDVPIAISLPRFAEPAQRYCPAGAYEVVRDADGSDPAFVINFQNCVHCKICDKTHRRT
jgi:hypothetical protein